MPAGKLQHRYHILNYHRTREYWTKGIIKFVHINGNNNPAAIVTKRHASNNCSHLMKPFIFLRDMDFLKKRVVAEGSENRSSTPPLYKAKDTPQQYFKLDIRHIIGV